MDDPGEPLPNNIYEEIHEKFSLLSQINENVNSAIQEINQLANPRLLTAMIEPLRRDHEDVMSRLREYLNVVFQPEPVPQNLEVSQMEQEVIRVLNTKDEFLKDLYLQSLMEVLEGLSKEEQGINDGINELMENFDGPATTKEVPPLSESVRKMEELKDITATLEGAVPETLELEGKIVHAVQKKIIDEFVTEFCKASGLHARGPNLEPAEPAPMNLGSGNAEKNLEDVMVEIYGFRSNEVKKITKSVANRKMSRTASFHPEGAGALNWETIKILREKFEDLKKRILDVKRVKRDHSQEDSDQGMPMPEGAVVHVDEKHEILRVLKNWVFRLECNFIALVHDLCAMMSGHEAAAAKFQEFESQLESLESHNPGMVSIAVYKVLAMKQIPIFQDGENLVPRVKPESSWAATDKGTLYERIEFDRMIDLLLEIILKLRGVLITSGLPRAEPQNIDSEVLDSYEEALQQVQEAMEEIERKLLWAMFRGGEVVSYPDGKGKRKRN